MRRHYLLLTALFSFSAFISKSQTCTASFEFRDSVRTNSMTHYVRFWPIPKHHENKAVTSICWNFGDGKDTCINASATPINTSSILHHYQQNGNYNVCVKIKYAGGCEANYCKTISLHTIADNSCRANFEIGQTDNTQRKLFVAQPWQSTGRKPEKICWDFGDGKDTCIVYNSNTSNNYAVYHKYEKAGTYKVCAKIIYSGGCISTTCKELKIEALEECGADFKLETLNTSGTSKQFIALPATNHQRKPVKICWQFGDGKDTCIQYPSTYTGHYTVNHTYARGGQYEACIEIVYAGGCEVRKCKKVEISTPATNICTVQIKELATIPEGLHRYLNAVPMSGLRPEKICWTFGDGKDTCITLSATTNLQHLNIGHKYPASGVYKTCVKLFYAGGCIAYQCHELVIKGENNVCGGYFTDATASPNTIIFNGFSLNALSDPVLSYLWVFGDGKMGSGSQVKHEYASGGTFQVCLFLKTTSGCETKICRNIFLPGRSNASQIQLHPNPVIHQIRVQFHSLHKEAVLISIFNSSGIVVRNYTRTAALGSNTWEFDLSGLSSGFYSVVVRSPRQVASSAFFKE